MKYQRFVAYVYEYRKGKKENNCGFLRVEARDGNVTVEVHIKCPGLPKDEKCNIYGFIRKAGLMEGILLGSAWSGAEKLDCIIESEKVENCSWINEFQLFGGMVILTDNGAFFGTEWDDQPIKPENFEERKKPRAVIEENPSMERDESSKVSDENKEEIFVGQNDENEETENKQDQPSIIAQETDESKKEVVQNNQEAKGEQKTKLKNAPYTELESESPNKVQNKSQKEPTFRPFNDDEISECRKIHPNEFFKSCPPACGLRNNRFLEHGYYNFGHLLVGKRADGQHILGVPGGYDQQERFMANMFGFPYFKESHEIQLPGGRGGYWYRLINPANFH